MDPFAQAYVNQRMNPDSNRIRQFGIPFKHNTGRAVCYLYTNRDIPDDNLSDLVSVLESWHIRTFDSWNQIKKVDLFNLNNTVYQRFFEWDHTMDIGPFKCDKVIKLQYISLVVRFNYEFHIRLI